MLEPIGFSPDICKTQNTRKQIRPLQLRSIRVDNMGSKQPSFFLLFLFLGAGEGGFKLSLLQWVSRWARGWENRGRTETPEAGDWA